MDLLIGRLLDLVHLRDGFLDLIGIEMAHDVIELVRGLAGELGGSGEAVIVERIVFLCHDGSLVWFEVRGT